MSFQPVIEIVEVPRDSSWVLLKDDTEPYHVTNNPGGWGAPGGPSSIADIISVIILTQWYGGTPTTVPLSNISGDLTSGLKAKTTLNDGVTLIHALYGMLISTGYTYSGKIITVPLTGSAFDEAWGGVTAITDSGDPTVIYRIKTMDNSTGTIELYEDWTGGTVVKYYSVIRKILVLNCGEGGLIKDIAGMAISSTGCENSNTLALMDRVLLKTAAQAAFSCGNYAKAHNAAVLLCDSKAIFKPCTTC